jgi:hypothetical protein
MRTIEPQHAVVYHFSHSFDRHVGPKGSFQVRHCTPTIAMLPNPRGSGVQTMCLITFGIVDQDFIIQLFDYQAVLPCEGSRFLN